MPTISDYISIANTNTYAVTLNKDNSKQSDTQLKTQGLSYHKGTLNQAVRNDFKRALESKFGQEITSFLNFKENSKFHLSAREIKLTLNKAQSLTDKAITNNANHLLVQFAERIYRGTYPNLDKNSIVKNGLLDLSKNLLLSLGKEGVSTLSAEQINRLCDNLANKAIQVQKPKGVEYLQTGVNYKYNSEDLAKSGSLEKGQVIGIYEFVKMKGAGVEPGFDGTKAWMSCHDEQLVTKGTKLNNEAYSIVSDLLNGKDIGNTIEQRTEIKDTCNEIKEEIEHLPSFSKAFDENGLLSDRLIDEIFSNDTLKNDIKGLIKQTDPYFCTLEHVKMDYSESDLKGNKVRIPKERSKGFFHREFSAKTKEQANLAAIKETIATDLMHAMGVNAQKARLVPASYADGSLKLMISSDHMSAIKDDHEVKFETLTGKIIDGILVKTDETGNKTSDDAVEGWGRNKILMLMLADRDAIGSRGDNKGRLGNDFAAIDPGHSLEGYMKLRNINSDFSFEQPHTIKSMKFKNFTVFDDSSFKEKMEGIKQLYNMRKEGKDTAVFDSYIAYFREAATDKSPNVQKEYYNYIKKIEDLRQSFIERRDYILDEVFSQRLEFANDEPYILEALDKLEKLTSKKVRNTSATGKIELRHLQVDGNSNRTIWNINRDGDGYKLSCSNIPSQKLDSLKTYIRAFNFGDNVLSQNGNNIVLNITKDKVEDFCQMMAEDKIKAFLK